jgi:hypothetical protein
VDYYDFTKTMDQNKAGKDYFINQVWTFINSRKISIGAQGGPECNPIPERNAVQGMPRY